MIGLFYVVRIVCCFVVLRSGSVLIVCVGLLVMVLSRCVNWWVICVVVFGRKSLVLWESVFCRVLLGEKESESLRLNFVFDGVMGSGLIVRFGSVSVVGVVLCMVNMIWKIGC